MYYVNMYSLKDDGDMKIQPHFRVREFKCQDGSDPIIIDPVLAYYLERVREYFGKPVNITSGYRSTEHNRAVGGASRSQHMYGLAADFYINGVAPTKIAAYLETLIPNTGGIGIYPKFVHLDVRNKRSRWYG